MIAATLHSSLGVLGESKSVFRINSTLNYKLGINLQFSVLSPSLDSQLSSYLHSTPSSSVSLRTPCN